MLTEKDYCDYDTCVALQELGLSFEDASQRFERNILTYRYEEVPRPLLYEAQKWLRRNKKIYIEVHIAFNKYFYELFKTDEYDKHCGIQKVLALGTNGYETPEEAIKKAFDWCVELKLIEK